MWVPPIYSSAQALKIYPNGISEAAGEPSQRDSVGFPVGVTVFWVALKYEYKLRSEGGKIPDSLESTRQTGQQIKWIATAVTVDSLSPDPSLLPQSSGGLSSSLQWLDLPCGLH